jgi:hypothetical protein
MNKRTAITLAALLLWLLLAPGMAAESENVAPLRSRAQKLAGIPAERIMLSATHLTKRGTQS